MNWYEVNNIQEVDSPALLIYPQRIQHNIQVMINTVGGDPKRLVPHVKTHKMPAIIRMQLNAGISRFKCATIAELEMCLAAGADWVLMAYQLTGPKIDRFIQLTEMYPDARIFSLTDNLAAATNLANKFRAREMEAAVFLDLNNGMNRTGFPLQSFDISTYKKFLAIGNLHLAGLHIYDGHIRNAEYAARKQQSDQAIQPLYELLDAIQKEGFPTPEVISGGSPSFSSAAAREGFYCSPGTTLLWDYGYSQLVPETAVEWAAVLITRVVSKPAPGLITTDLGHKSVSAENPLDKRIKFLNLEDYEPVSQSEEHLVLKVRNWDSIQIGDCFYGIPYHVCPTVALYDQAQVIKHHQKTEEWTVEARRKKLTV